MILYRKKNWIKKKSKKDKIRILNFNANHIQINKLIIIRHKKKRRGELIKDMLRYGKWIMKSKIF